MLKYSPGASGGLQQTGWQTEGEEEPQGPPDTREGEAVQTPSLGSGALGGPRAVGCSAGWEELWRLEDPMEGSEDPSGKASEAPFTLGPGSLLRPPLPSGALFYPPG